MTYNSKITMKTENVSEYNNIIISQWNQNNSLFFITKLI